MPDFPKILAVAAVVMDENGSILLRRREKDPGKGTWELFAGYVEPGERLKDAVRRRLREKGGITNVSSTEFSGNYYDDPARHPGVPCIPLAFKVKMMNAEVAANETMKWFSPAEVASSELALDNKKIIQDVIGNGL